MNEIVKCLYWQTFVYKHRIMFICDINYWIGICADGSGKTIHVQDLNNFIGPYVV